MFYLGGAIPLISLLLLAAWLPESLPFLVLNFAPAARIARIVRKLDPTCRLDPMPHFTVHEPKLAGFTVIHLFRDGRAAMTVLLWTAQFINLLVLLFLLNWTPSLLREAGLSLQTAIWTTVGFSCGGVISTIAVGRLMDRYKPFAVLAITLIGTACCIAVVSHAIGNTWLLQAAVCVTGFGVAGCQNSINTVSGMLYPTAIRSTGVGWSMGIGRIGSIVGPFLGGVLLTAHWEVPTRSSCCKPCPRCSPRCACSVFRSYAQSRHGQRRSTYHRRRENTLERHRRASRHLEGRGLGPSPSARDHVPNDRHARHDRDVRPYLVAYPDNGARSDHAGRGRGKDHRPRR